VLPTQNGPQRCRIGRTLQYLRSSRYILSPDDRALVESISGWTWNVHGDKFHARLSEFIAEVALHPSGQLSHRVRNWASFCVRKRRRGELSQERIDILSATPGWVWQTSRASAWILGLRFIQKTKAVLRSANVLVAEGRTRAASRAFVAVSQSASMLLLPRPPFSLLTLQRMAIGMNLKALIKDQ